MDQQALVGIALFDGMSDAELKESAAAFEQTQVLMGKSLTSQNDFGYSFFIVLSGRVEVEIGGETVAQLGAGDHFGEVALVQGNKRNATVKALETCELAKIMTWDFQELMAHNPTLAARLKDAADKRSSPPRSSPPRS